MTKAKRLHISPLNLELLPTVLSGPLLDKASNISFHTIQTSPEKDYGYIELPEAEADKLKRKLNGSTLKGFKMRVGEARPKNAVKKQTAEETETPEAKIFKGKKRRAKEEGVLLGHELQERKVKRGWTEPTSESKLMTRHKDTGDKKSKAKASSLTGVAECLFKAKLPPNAATSEKSKDDKVKKRKRGESSREVVVHEFSNTTKHASFLRGESGSASKKPASEFVEGQGWVDEDGSVVEPVPKRRRSKAKSVEDVNHEAQVVDKPRSRRSSRLEVPSVQVTAPRQRRAPPAVVENDETSSSGTSGSDDESESSGHASVPPKPSTPRQKKGMRGASKTGLGRSDSIDQIERLSITRSSATPPASEGSSPSSVLAANEVHPLEALFKRPKIAASDTSKKPNLEVTTSFSFFEPDADEGSTQALLMPQTPFTQQDIRQRRQRSAAPTPDTAAPGKTFGHVWEGTSDNSESDDDEERTTPGSKDHSAAPDVKEEKPESEFSKWFWEHRGENNRAWKRRRREAAKEKRQKDNKDRRG